MMILVHSMTDMPDINMRQNYTIEYKILDNEIKYKLDFSNG